MPESGPTNPFIKTSDRDKEDIEAAVNGLARKIKRQELARPSAVHRPGGARPVQSGSFLSEAVTVASDSGTPATAVAWTTFNAAPYIPQGSKGVILQCRGRSVHGPTGEKAVNVRRESGGIELQVVSVRGTTTSDITSMVAQARCDVTGSRTFDYTVVDDVTEYEIKLVGFY